MPVASVPRFVADLSARLQSLETEFHRAYWDVQVAATPENEKRRAELELELRRVKGDVEAYRTVTAALEHEVHDPMLRRQLEVLRLSLTSNQMDDERRAEIVRLSSAIEGDFATFRPELQGERVGDSEIEKILRSSNDDGERADAWRASKRVGAVVADRVLDLVRIRNEVALELGYPDYYRMGLELQELPESWLFDRLDELERLTAEPFAAWKKGLDTRLSQRFGVETVRPWHYADPFFQTLPPEGGVALDGVLQGTDAADLALKTFGAWDIDLTGVMEASDLFPRELKCQHAFCIDIDRSGKDVRILANIVPGENWTQIMLHESGHAAYDASIDTKLPYLLRRCTHIFVTEAIAILSGRLVRDPNWLEQIAGVARDEAAALAVDLRRASGVESMQFARWGLVMVHFERELYSDPGGDLDARWWELVERFQNIPAPPDAPEGAWAAKIHLATAPVYYQNYLLGEMLASQLTASARPAGESLIGSPEAGRFLKERIFRPGALLRWDALIEEATGRGLSAKDFAADVLS